MSQRLQHLVHPLFVDSARFGIIIGDVHGNIIFSNRQALSIYDARCPGPFVRAWTLFKQKNIF